jgi:hypothetical protein
LAQSLFPAPSSVEGLVGTQVSIQQMRAAEKEQAPAPDPEINPRLEG